MAELTRSDFFSQEDWLRHLHESGLEPVDAKGRATTDFAGSGPYARLAQAIHGPTAPRAPQRPTFFLSTRAFLGLYRAVALANLNGYVLNTFITISWSTLGYDDDRDIGVAQMRFLDLFRHWCADNDNWHGLIWTKERSSRMGLHSHILAHIPWTQSVAFATWARAALKTISGKPVVRPRSGQKGATAATLHIVPVEEYDGVAHQWRIFRYLTKGISEPALVRLLKSHWSPALIEAFHGDRFVPQGRIVGKRQGQSRSLDAAAQALFDDERGLPFYWPKDGAADSELSFDDRYFTAPQGAVWRERLASLDI